MSPKNPFTKKTRNLQKLFGCIGSQLSGLLPALSTIKITVRKGKRCKPKKNDGRDHALQFFSAKLCGNKSVYCMNAAKTPKTLRKKGILFLKKSTHYDTVAAVDLDSVWIANAKALEPITKINDQVLLMLDGTPDRLESEKYEASRKGYVGRKKGKPVTENSHQIFSVSLAQKKLFLYETRCPGNYNAFSNPTRHNDTGLSGLSFNQTIAQHCLAKAHALLPDKRFLWLFDRGFDKIGFWLEIKNRGDDFITALDKNAECVKAEQRLIDLQAVVLKKGPGFDYHETLVHVEGMHLKAVYIKPVGAVPAYWLVCSKLDCSGEEIKKTYNVRSGDEPLYDYLKNDYNAKKPCKKSFAGAQAHTALLCLVHNLISLLSQKIFGSYHRLTTLIGFLLDTLALDFLFGTMKPISQVLAPNNPERSANGSKKKQ